MLLDIPTLLSSKTTYQSSKSMKTRKVRLKKRSKPEKVTRRGIVLFVGLISLFVVCFVFGLRIGIEKKDAALSQNSDLESRGLYYQLEMDKTDYEKGEPISVKLSVANISPKPVVLSFQKNLEFELIVRKEVDLVVAQLPQVVWKRSDDYPIINEFHTIRIDAGRTMEFEGVWDQTNRQDKAVEAGHYQIIGRLLADNRSESLQIRGEMK